MSRPNLQFFGFCFLFFTSYLLGPFRAGAREGILSVGGGNFVYLYVFSPPSVFALSAACGGTVAVPCFCFGRRYALAKTDRCPCSASAVSATGSASAAQSRTRGRLPSQSRRPCGRLASSPGGRAKFTPVDRENFVVRRSFFSFALPQTLPKLTQVHLPPPAGEVAQRFAL